MLFRQHIYKQNVRIAKHSLYRALSFINKVYAGVNRIRSNLSRSGIKLLPPMTILLFSFSDTVRDFLFGVSSFSFGVTFLLSALLGGDRVRASLSFRLLAKLFRDLNREAADPSVLLVPEESELLSFLITTWSGSFSPLKFRRLVECSIFLSCL